MVPQTEIPQNALKNNFMGATESEVDPAKSNKRTGLTELQLKMLNFPSTKDRVQSAKSSTTNGQSSS